MKKSHHLWIQFSQFFPQQKKIIEPGSNCLEGSYAHHYTTDALTEE